MASTTPTYNSILATAGFASAVSPVTSTTRRTDDEGIKAGLIEIPVGAERIPAYRAAPRSGGPFPTVLVVQEIFGVHEHIRDVTRRLAKLGYLAIAPELFYRRGDVSRLTDLQEIRGIVAKVPDAQVLGDLDATARWAWLHGEGDPQRLGLTGFCWGGRIAWLYAAHNPSLKAAVAWYGRLNGERSVSQPTHPIDAVAQLRVPVLGLYGGDDKGIPLGDVDAFRAAAERAEVAGVEIQVYPDAPHAFFADYRPSYREEIATDGWRRLQEWFRQHGVAPV
jgi:carboxymethylenebutenolidase